MSRQLISLIIPAYKQQKTIVKDLRRIYRVLQKIRHRFEIICVVDGMIDKTYEKSYLFSKNYRNIKVVGYETNHGKGYAVRYGMARARGDIVAFIDSGMDLNPNGLSMLLEHFEWYNADIIVGSKRHPVSKVVYPFDRKILSFLSQLYIRFLFGLNIRDTKVGMKFFRREVIKDVLPRLLVKKFAFDIEILVIAYYLGYKKIFEAPIEVRHKFEGSIVSQNLLPIILNTFIDTLGIFYRLKILHYYDDISKRKWVFDPELRFRISKT